MSRRKRSPGFTLIEMLIVIIIVILLAFMIVALFNEMFRGQGVREAARIVQQAVSDAREFAAKERVMHFLKMYNATDGGVIEVWKDTDGDKQLTGGDKMVAGGKIDLPKWCYFVNSTSGSGLGAINTPGFHWVGFEPTGYCKYNPGFTGVEASQFDTNWNGATPQLVGDVCIEIKNQPYKMGIDIDRVAGKVRRHEFLYTGN